MNFATVRPHTLPHSSSQALEDPQKAQTPTPEPFDIETRKVRWLWWVSGSPALFGAQAGKRGATCRTLLHSLHHFSLFSPGVRERVKRRQTQPGMGSKGSGQEPQDVSWRWDGD